MVQEHDVFALGQRQCIVGGMDDVPGCAAVGDLDTRIGAVMQRLQVCQRICPPRCVIANAQFPLAVPLSTHGLYGCVQKCAGRIVHRHDDGYQWLAGEAGNALWRLLVQVLQQDGFGLQPLAVG